MNLEIVEGDLLDQPVEAIVNAWNRNILPWWLLLPQGVSGAIKRRAGINMLWRSSEFSIKECVRSAMRIVREQGFRSVAFPLIGAGTGGGRDELVLRLMVDQLRSEAFEGEVRVVRYAPSRSR